MSSSDTAISIRGLSKAYTIRHDGLKRASFREAVVERVKHPFRKANQETFWALSDINMEIQKGEVVGIIGRNGAGKSTLLKVLSRIVEPTRGAADLYGRVGSLLEVGTGFHPELTGRENIYLNGAILGMRRSEIVRQFDAIVEFSGVERFLDTPVKRYSSGMYVRLAFAVAAHLNPEILIVDEVLAVGDAQFQKKCLGKMKEVSEGEGRTVLFVSHNMAAVQNLCQRCVLLMDGRVSRDGTTAEVVPAYMAMASSAAGVRIGERKDRSGSGAVRCTGLRILEASGEEARAIRPNEAFAIEVEVMNFAPVQQVAASIDIDMVEGFRVTTMYSGFLGQTLPLRPGRNVLRCESSGLNIRPDQYSLNVMLAGITEVCDFVLSAMVLEVEESDMLKSGRLPERVHGPMVASYRWSSGVDGAGSGRSPRQAELP